MNYTRNGDHNRLRRRINANLSLILKEKETTRKTISDIMRRYHIGGYQRETESDYIISDLYKARDDLKEKSK